jgi:hypothetical protein
MQWLFIVVAIQECPNKVHQGKHPGSRAPRLLHQTSRDTRSPHSNKLGWGVLTVGK